jgi:superfamily II DNA or RNA helicase
VAAQALLNGPRVRAFLDEASYHPVLVTLSGAESERYLELSMRIARECASADEVENGERSDILDALLIKRARLIATAENKTEALRVIMRSRAETNYNLVYCGDGTVETASDEAVLRQMDVVTRVLGLDLNMKVARYVAETPLLRREKLRRDFSEGKVQCLVAIRCLDEGVDIPETRRAFILASSSNPRQFIQRRGRVLRRAPGKERAEIYDFIVTPPAEFADQTHFNVDRQLLKKELTRVATFARSAINGPEALGNLLPLREKFNLLDVY